jgi:hypothetical protein
MFIVMSQCLTLSFKFCYSQQASNHPSQCDVLTAVGSVNTNLNTDIEWIFVQLVLFPCMCVIVVL